MNTRNQAVRWSVLCLFAVLACYSALMGQQRGSFSVFAVERQKKWFGSGAAISPDGNLVVYIGNGDNGDWDHALYVYNITYKTKTLVMRDAEGLDVFYNPVFSPDGSRIAFAASDGTLNSPSDIFTIGVDGTGLVRLTTTVDQQLDVQGAGQPRFVRYNYSPQFSPDGSMIAFLSHDVLGNADFVDVMSSDGTARRTLTRGTLLMWSADGANILFTTDGDALAKRMQINVSGTGLPQNVPEDPRSQFIGRLAEGQIVERIGGTVQAVSEAQSSPSASARSLSSIPAARFASVPPLAPPVPGEQDPSVLLLRSVMGTKSARALLTYSSDDIERIEVVDLPLAR